MTSRFTYTMEEPGELMERLAQFEQHMDQLYSLSNSGKSYLIRRFNGSIG
ncbi:hypothetical protein AHF37_06355 [Paragonimus kellicotti]|nr:hypothetical protein AHF37_06355 [Paragonimus kellicotti]